MDSAGVGNGWKSQSLPELILDSAAKRLTAEMRNQLKELTQLENMRR